MGCYAEQRGDVCSLIKKRSYNFPIHSQAEVDRRREAKERKEKNKEKSMVVQKVR